MTGLYLFLVILWFGLLTLRAPGLWALAAFDASLFGLAAAMIVRRRFEVRLHPIGVLLAVPAILALVQAAAKITVDPQRTREAALGWSANCAAFSLAAALSERRRRFLDTQLAFATLLSIGAVIALFASGTLGPFVYKNQFAAYVEVALGIAIVASLRDRRWIAAAAMLFASVVAAGSRAGAILCAAELLVVPLLAFGRGRIAKGAAPRLATVAAAATLVLVGVVGPQRLIDRFQEPHPYALRANLLRSSIAMARERPMEGFGLGAWSSAYPAFARFDDGDFVNQAHNDWAQWLAEGGAPMLLVMLAVVALLARPAFDSLWGLGLMAVFLHAFVDYPFEQRPALAAFFFAMAGALAGARREYADERL